MNGERKITLELPCDVGQMVYVVSNKDDKFNPVVYRSEIERFNYTVNYRGRKKLTVRVKKLYDCDERKDVYGGGTFNVSSFGNLLFFTLDEVKKRLNGADFTLYYSIGGFAVGKKEITCANVTNSEKVSAEC